VTLTTSFRKRILDTVQARLFFNYEWRHYQRISALLTARYLVGVPIRHWRGNHEMARACAKVLLAHGNFVLGVPWAARRSAEEIVPAHQRQNRSRLVTPEPWMGPPT